jgi:cytochrome c
MNAPHFGQPISPADAAAWDISIGPDGIGLPPGSGTPAQGAVFYAQKCAVCHGDKGEGKTNAPLTAPPPFRFTDAGGCHRLRRR